MTKNHMIAYTVIGLLFGAIGAYVGLEQKGPNPVTTTIAPTDGRAHSAVDALFAETLKDTAGVAQPLAQWKGKALVVNFWAPWCAPCVEEMPELAELALELSPKNINVIGIGIDSPANIAQFASKFNIRYPLYVAGMTGSDLARGFGNAAGGLPYTVLIGADGQVRKTYLGILKFDELKADLAALDS